MFLTIAFIWAIEHKNLSKILAPKAPSRLSVARPKPAAAIFAKIFAPKAPSRLSVARPKRAAAIFAKIFAPKAPSRLAVHMSNRS